MSPRWIGFLVFVWFVGILITLIGEGAVISANETNVLNKVLGWQEVKTETDLSPMSYIGNLPNLFSGIMTMLFMNFSFWKDSGPWDMVRMAIAPPIIATIVIGLIITFFSLFSKNV